MTILCCPNCSNTFDSEDTPAMPFCCERCRQIDLFAWIDERRAVPYESSDEELDVGE